MPFISADINVTDIADNFYLDWYVTSIFQNLTEYFVGADYYELMFVFGDTEYFLYTTDQAGSYSWYTSDCYWNITLGAQYIWNGSDSNFYKHGLNINRDYCASNGSLYYGYTLFPVELTAWTTEGEGVTQFLTIQAEGWDASVPVTTDYLPSNIRTFPDDEVSYEENYVLYMNKYFRNYDWVQFYMDYNNGETIVSRSVSLSSNEIEVWAPENLEEYNFSWILAPDTSEGAQDIVFDLFNFVDTETNVSFSVEAWNEYGFAYDSFNLTLLPQVDALSGRAVPYVYNDSESQNSFIGYIVGLTRAVYPHYSGMSSPTRFGYIIITLLLLNIGFIFLMIKTGSVKYVGLILLVLDFLCLLYFTSIRYLPAGTWILIGALVVSIPIIKSKLVG